MGLVRLAAAIERGSKVKKVSLLPRPKPLVKECVMFKKVILPKLSWTTDRLHAVLRSLNVDTDKDYYDPFDERLFSFEQEGFPDCCAFDVFCGLLLANKPEKWTERQYLAKIILELREEFNAPYALFATAKQPEIEALLVKLGAEKLKTVRNPNSGNMVTLWLLSTPR